MKYRRLTPDELSELETEFIQFLAANTITGQDWEKLKEEIRDQAEELIDLFSDIVFERVLAQINFLEISTPKDIRTFSCEPQVIRMNGIRIAGETNIDFTQTGDPQAMIAHVQQSGAVLQFYSGEKAYQPNRSEELFRMMQQGALISRDGHLYKTLESLKGTPSE